MRLQLARLNVKLSPGADLTEARRRLSRNPGVERVIQTFPDENDPELGSLYLLEVEPTHVQEVLQRLRGDSSVDYVEQAPVRKLILPRSRARRAS